MKGDERMLVSRFRYLGDVLLATPFLRALRAALPGGRISMLVDKGTEDVLLNNPDIDEVLVFDKAAGLAWKSGFVFELRGKGFDVAIDLTGSDRGAWLAFLSGARQRVGFRGNNYFRRKFLYNLLVPQLDAYVHQVERNLAVAKALGIEHKGLRPTLVLTQEEMSAGRALVGSIDRYAVIHPGARRWYKRWPLENFARTSDVLKDMGIDVVLTGAIEDSELTAKISSLMEKAPVDLAGKTTVRELAAIIKDAVVFIGNDSAPLHIASALGVKSIGLFGPTDWRNWGPVGPDARVFMKEGFTCRPCGHARECPEGQGYCMAHISFEEVRDALLEMLDKRPLA
ncbi:MAG: putative lipopolysaccharide heptosyltransferase III [Deltaproteobacteria bacterium]|nr:putative lipopolysaccharide heptosyltransferase III [Deltaproteobacteria bacterium]